jgi:hypothetical protein
MTPEELAAMRAGLDPRAYYQDPYAAARAGLVDPESLPSRGATPILSGIPTLPGPGLREQATEVLGKGKQKLGEGKVAAQDFLKRYPQASSYARGGLAIAGALPAVGTSLEELQAGRPLGAVAALAPAGLSAAGAALIGKGPIGTVAGLGLMGLGAILPGAAASGAESTRQSLTGKPTKGKEEEFSTQLAMRGQIMNQNLDGLERSVATNLQATKDLTTYYNQAQVQQFKAMAPELEKAKMNDFARYQTAMALQGQIQGQLGTLATAGALAQGAQQGNYLLTQTALTNNPYAGATIQAPQIRFG